jgi:DNA-binding transcriptional MocR family regulator
VAFLEAKVARTHPTHEVPIPRPNPHGGALYRQVVDAIEAGIRSGQLRVGQRLPAERKLAVQLGVSRTTVTGAYQELEARGLLRGHVGRGTIVVGAPPDSASQAFPWSQRASSLARQAGQLSFGSHAHRADVIRFDVGWSDRDLYPLAELNTLLREIAADGSPDLYRAPRTGGDPALREAVSRWLHSRGMTVPPEAILVTSGAQQGLNIVARAFLEPGDVVVTETPTFLGGLMAFRWAGADVIGVPVDHEGIQPDLLEEALVRHRPKLIYLMPTFQNPTGAVLGRERRRLTLELAMRYRVPVMESDVYGETYFDEPPPPPLKALDATGLVIYQGSISKLAVPGLRVGWLAAPRGAWAPLAAAKAFADLHTAPLTQRLAARFLESPRLEGHLAMSRAECRRRRDHLVAALRRELPRLTFSVPSGSYYLWAELPPPVRAEDLALSAAAHGVMVRPGSDLTPERGGEGYIRLCFAGLEPAGLTEGAKRLAAAVDEVTQRLDGSARREPAPAMSVV